MTVQYLIAYYYERGIRDTVVVKDALSHVNQNLKFSFNIIEDARSAMFYAMGKSQTLQRPVILIVKSEHITNCYTGLVEAWFQQMPVILISLDTEKVDYSYLDRCIEHKVAIKKGRRTGNDQLEGSLRVPGPSLVVLPGMEPLSASVVKRMEIAQSIRSLPSDAIIFCSARYSESLTVTNTVYWIEEKDKYGVVSNYLGYINGYEGHACLIIPMEWTGLDLNIFHTRYLNERFKLVLIQDKGTFYVDIVHWISYNSIRIFDARSEDSSVYCSFFTAKQPSVLILGS